MATVNITLHSDKAERFREIKAEIEAKLGYEPTNTEVVGMIMAQWNDDDLL